MIKVRRVYPSERRDLVYHSMVDMAPVCRPDGSLAYRTTRHDLYTRLKLIAIALLIAGSFFGLGAYGHLKYGGTPDWDGEMKFQVYLLEGIGGIFFLWMLLFFLGWFRKRLSLSVDDNGKIVVVARGLLGTREEAYPADRISKIEYLVRPVTVRAPDVNEFSATGRA